MSAVNYPDPTPLIKAFLRANPHQIALVGMGAEGCALGTRDGVRFFPAATMEAPAIDTNGAGDGLAVGILASYVLDGYSLADSVWRGQIAARYTCTQKASTSSLISMEKLDRFFEEFRRGE